MIPDNSAEVTSSPLSSWLNSQFWQYTHFILQWAKNMVPEPLLPEIGGSSPWCGAQLYTEALTPALQYPFAWQLRFAPHLRGQIEQLSIEPFRRELAFRTSSNFFGSILTGRVFAGQSEYKEACNEDAAETLGGSQQPEEAGAFRHEVSVTHSREGYHAVVQVIIPPHYV